MSLSWKTSQLPLHLATMSLTPSLVSLQCHYCLPPTAHTLLGFSFSGEVREPFPAVIQAMQDTKVPVTSVDAPSSWNIEEGPPRSGVGSAFHPDVLVSLTAPKPLVKYFKGRHFIGGRYVPYPTTSLAGVMSLCPLPFDSTLPSVSLASSL
jgi:hypothetical protein